MKTFVLVHGAWHGGWCYSRVARTLRAAGHEVYTPTLTGLGERSHLSHATINLSTHIQDIVNVVLWEDLREVILCGHSYGGMVVTGVAEAACDRIRALVYLDAFVPERDGDSISSLLAASGQSNALPGIQAEGWSISPIPAEAFNVNARDRAWVDSKCVKQPLATTFQAIKLGDN